MVALAALCLASGCRKKAAKVDPNAWPQEGIDGFVSGCVEKAPPGVDGVVVCTCAAHRLRQKWTWQEFRDFSEKGRDLTKMSHEQLTTIETAMSECIDAARAPREP